MWLPIVVFAGSAALVGGMKSLSRGGRPNLAQMLAAPKSGRGMAQAGDLECQPRLRWSLFVLGTTLAGRYLTALPLALAITPLAVYLQWPWIKSAWLDLMERHSLKTTGLMPVVLVGGWIAGFYVSIAFALFAYLLSRKINLLSGERSRQKLLHLFVRQPQTIWLLVDGAEVETPMNEVHVGDVVVAYAGESIPVDGIVVAGNAAVGQQNLTGDAKPVERSWGDHVFATTLVQRGWLHVRVERAGNQTVAMRLANMMGHTSPCPLPAERRGLKLAQDCVMPSAVLGMAALSLLGANSALAVLLARPGMEMNGAAPLALQNFIYLCAENGILVKDGRALELMHTVDTVVFDMTGSLTLEQPEVFSIHTCGKLEKWEVLAHAAAAEQLQSHPIAKAIVEEAKQCGLKLPDTLKIYCDADFGVQASIGGLRVHVGNLLFVGNGWITLPSVLVNRQTQCAELGHSLVFVTVDGVLAGALELRPALQPSAKDVVAELKRRDLRLAIFSGDHLEPTRQIAQRLGIEECFAEMLPEDKARQIERLQQEGCSVCFLGDGVNNATALQSANVSVSVRGFTSAEQEAAHVILMGQSLAQLPLFIDLSQRLDFNLETSFKMSVATGGGIIGGVFLLHGGIAGMAALSLLANIAITGNTMLPLRNTLKCRAKAAGPTPVAPARWIEP